MSCFPEAQLELRQQRHVGHVRVCWLEWPDDRDEGDVGHHQALQGKTEGQELERVPTLDGDRSRGDQSQNAGQRKEMGGAERLPISAVQGAKIAFKVGEEGDVQLSVCVPVLWDNSLTDWTILY